MLPHNGGKRAESGIYEIPGVPVALPCAVVSWSMANHGDPVKAGPLKTWVL